MQETIWTFVSQDADTELFRQEYVTSNSTDGGDNSSSYTFYELLPGSYLFSIMDLGGEFTSEHIVSRIDAYEANELANSKFHFLILAAYRKWNFQQWHLWRYDYLFQ